MSEVSCRAFAMLFPALEAAGIPPERVVEASPYSLAYLRAPKNRLPWDDFADLLERVGELLGSPEALVHLGGEMAAQPATSRLFGLAGLVASPRQLYWLMCRYLGNAVFGIVESQLLLSTRRRAIVEMRIPPPYKDCPSFFLISRGNIAHLPTLLGYPPAEVTLERRERYARFDIAIRPRPPGALLRSLPRKLELHLSASRLSDELAERQDELSQAIVELRAANTRIEQQKRALERQVEELDRLREEAERRSAEQRELDRKVQQTQRLESLGLLAGGVAHDFNNLLMIISAHGSLAESTLGAAAPARAHLAQIRDAIERAKKLTGQMLAYAGRSQIDLGPIHVQDVLGDIDRLLSATLPPTVALQIDVPEAFPTVVADPAQLQQVCMNLITNAAEAIGGADGTIELRAALEDHVTHADDGAAPSPPPARYLRLTVRDDGPGMDAETRGRIFDPFYSKKGPGRGLGLAAVLGIVRAHKGSIDVQSEPGAGALFSVRLPLRSERRAAAIDLVERPRDATRPPGRGVLLVDDEPQVLNTTAKLLRNRGFSVQTASDGERALEVVERDPAAIGVVVLDLTMPGMRSDELHRRIRERWPQIRVVFSSGYDARDSARRLGEHVSERFLQKPYSAQELVDAISGR